MKIKEIRTRVIEWRGKTVPLPPHFCTNPMDAVSPMLTKATMGTFTFHSWLIVEIFTDNGLVGIGNAALSPRVTKQVIDLYLKPLLHRRRSVGHRISLAAHVSQDDGVWPQRHRHGRHQRGGHRALGHSRQVREAAGLSPARRAHEAENSGLCEPALQHAAGRTRARIEKIQGRRLQGDEAALRLGADRRRGRNAEKSRAGPHRARGGRRRRGHHGRRLHGLESGLREAHDSAARTVESPLARRTGHSR